jgi:tetratricopeptide (TPR) repeat protein
LALPAAAPPPGAVLPPPSPAANPVVQASSLLPGSALHSPDLARTSHLDLLPEAPAGHPALSSSNLLFASTNLVHSGAPETQARQQAEFLATLNRQLDTGRHLRLARLHHEATAHFVAVLSRQAPDELHRTALLELALIAQEEKQWTRALQILSQYLVRWPQDPSAPEILLRQGLLYRQLGLHELALTKFYATMTTALVLKNNHFDYYRKLVLQSQAEVAETLALQNRHAEAAEAFARLLKEESPALNRPRVQYRYVLTLEAQERYAEAAAQAQDFLTHYPDAPEQAELRFLLASALKKLGRNDDALRHVLLLLQSQQALAHTDPATLAYWQQRAGNDIANRLYQEGDFVNALDLYLNLLPLSPTPAWQLPVLYQIGLVYERLEQPSRAIASYEGLLTRQPDLGTNAPPSLVALADMARWRRDFLTWRADTQLAHRELRAGASPPPPPPPPVTPATAANP